MPGLGTLSVYLNANTSKFKKGLGGALRSTKQFTAGLNTAVKGGILAFGAAAAVTAVKSVQAWGAQEDAITKLNTVLKSTGGAAGFSSKQLQRTAASLQNVTAFGDEAVINTQALLATFTNIKGDAFKSATETILDMSVALGQDTKQGAIQLGKALNDPIKGVTALSRVGVSFTEQQKANIKELVDAGKTQEAQFIILNELQTEFGGQAKANADTVLGRQKQMNNAWGDMFEQIGKTITGASDLKGVFVEVTETIKGVTNWIKTNGQIWVDVFKMLWVEVKYSFKQIWSVIVNTLANTVTYFENTAKNYIEIFTWIYNNFTKIIKNSGKIFEAFLTDIFVLIDNVAKNVNIWDALFDPSSVDFTKVMKGVGKNLQNAVKDAGITELTLTPITKNMINIIDEIAEIVKEKDAELAALLKKRADELAKPIKTEAKKKEDAITKAISTSESKQTLSKNLAPAIEAGSIEAYRATSKKSNDPASQTADNTKAIAKSTAEIAKKSSPQVVSIIGFTGG